MARKLFGTDGVRGRANDAPMTAETALRLGQAAGRYFTNGGHAHRVLIGKDTRRSGYMLETALTAGFTSVGMNVFLVGPVPTPAVGMLARSMRADLGVMISASHNPFEDNGIKFFGPDGFKLSDAAEEAIEALLEGEPALRRPGRDRPRHPHRRRARPLHGVRQDHLPARPAARRAEGRGRLRQRRGLPHRARGALGARRRGGPARRRPRTASTSTATAARPTPQAAVEAVHGARRRPRHQPRRRRRPGDDHRREGRGRRRRPVHGADRRPLGARGPARQGHARRHGDVEPRARAPPARAGADAAPHRRRRPLRRRGDARGRLQPRRRAVRPHRDDRLRHHRRRADRGAAVPLGDGRDRPAGQRARRASSRPSRRC